MEDVPYCHERCEMRYTEDDYVRIGSWSKAVLEWDCHARYILYLGICLVCPERHYYVGKTKQVIRSRFDQYQCQIRKGRKNQTDSLVKHFVAKHPKLEPNRQTLAVAQVSGAYADEDDLYWAEKDLISETGNALKKINRYHCLMNQRC